MILTQSFMLMTYKKKTTHIVVPPPIATLGSPSSHSGVHMSPPPSSTLSHLQLSLSPTKIACRLSNIPLLSLNELGLPLEALDV